MVRQNLSFTQPNNEWIKNQVDWIRTKLEKAENSGLTKDSKADILKQSKNLING